MPRLDPVSVAHGEPSSGRRKLARAPTWLWGVVAALLAASYSRMFTNSPVWDDRYLVTGNPYILDASRLRDLLTHDLWTASALGEPSSYYRPLTMLSYWLNARLGGAGVASFHAGNLLVHAAVAATLVGLARRALSPHGPRTAGAWIAPAAAGAWFALAPATSEAVLWISGRFDPLGALFTLAALLCNRSNRSARTAATVALCAGALLSKESFAIVPLLLLAHDVLVCRRGFRQIALKYVALVAVVAGYLLARRALGVVSLSVLATTGVLSLVRSFAWMAVLIGVMALFPTRLDPFRRYEPFGALGTVAALLALAVISGIVALLIVRRRDEHAPRLIGLGWFTFLVALVPVAVTGPNLGIVGDRYAYVPAAGLALVLAGFIELARAEWLARGSSRPVALAASALALAVFGLEAARVARRVPDWRDERTLTLASIRADPNSPEALYQLGQLEAEAGNLPEADRLLSHADRERPGYWRTRTAVCYLRLHQDRLTEAEATCLDAARLNPTNPRAFANLSATYIRMRDWPRGLEAARRALAIKPAYAEAHFEVGLCLANLGQLAEAAAETHAALVLDPRHAEALRLRRQLDAHRAP